jgi:hypothetical protein
MMARTRTVRHELFSRVATAEEVHRRDQDGSIAARHGGGLRDPCGRITIGGDHFPDDERPAPSQDGERARDEAGSPVDSYENGRNDSDSDHAGHWRAENDQPQRRARLDALRQWGTGREHLDARSREQARQRPQSTV